MMGLKTCDTCGEVSYYMEEVFEHLQTSDVKKICSQCAEIVNKYSERMHNFAETEALRAQKAMEKRVNKLQKERLVDRAFSFLIGVRSYFKKQVIHSAFSVVKKES